MSAEIDRLLDIMARLRDPEHGCPWDVEQTFETIAPYTIEEAYEVAEAIRTGDMTALADELGDLLLQVVFHARMASEAGHFDFAAVVRGICDKMVRRHPHVFADESVDSAASQTRAWEAHKERERRARGEGERGALAGVPLAMPALLRAEKLGRRAARVGFDWPDAAPVAAKVREELGELEAEMSGDGEAARLEHEVGDLLFACANLARHVGVNPETALRLANARFEGRFRHIEARLAEHGRRPADVSLDALERLWQEAKAAERAPAGSKEE